MVKLPLFAHSDEKMRLTGELVVLNGKNKEVELD